MRRNPRRNLRAPLNRRPDLAPEATVPGSTRGPGRARMSMDAVPDAAANSTSPATGGLPACTCFSHAARRSGSRRSGRVLGFSDSSALGRARYLRNPGSFRTGAPSGACWVCGAVACAIGSRRGEPARPRAVLRAFIAQLAACRWVPISASSRSTDCLGMASDCQAAPTAPAVFVLFFVRSAPGPCAILLLASPEPCRPVPGRGTVDRHAGLVAGGVAVWGSFIGIAMRLPIGSNPFTSRA